jgi:hypothetical protein
LARLGLAGDRIHGGGDRAAFAQGRPDRAEGDRDRRRDDADALDANQFMGLSFVSGFCFADCAPMNTIARIAKM